MTAKKEIKGDWLIVGLGNPGLEYESSRHNAGRLVLLDFTKKPPAEVELGSWRTELKIKAELAEGRLGKKKFRFLLPDNFMNNSGNCVKPLIKNKEAAKKLAVIHDDVDLPLGTVKISYNRGSGGHRGVESIIKALKTQEFARIRIGVSPATPSGKLKKPKSDKVIDFIIGNFKPAEKEVLKKTIKKTKEIIVSLIENGLEKTANSFN